MPPPLLRLIAVVCGSGGWNHFQVYLNVNPTHNTHICRFFFLEKPKGQLQITNQFKTKKKVFWKAQCPNQKLFFWQIHFVIAKWHKLKIKKMLPILMRHWLVCIFFFKNQNNKLLLFLQFADYRYFFFWCQLIFTIMLKCLNIS